MGKFLFHTSRWQFWWGYFIVFVLAMFSIWLWDAGEDGMSLFFGALAVVLYVILELMTRLERVVLDDRVVEFHTGLLHRKSFRTPYSAIASVELIQAPLQRLFKTGDVLIDTPGTERVEITLRNFNNAPRIERIVRERMHHKVRA